MTAGPNFTRPGAGRTAAAAAGRRRLLPLLLETNLRPGGLHLGRHGEVHTRSPGSLTQVDRLTGANVSGPGGQSSGP